MVADTPPGTLYEGVRQLRGIALLGDAYVVFDRVVCEQPRTIDRYQWGKGQAGARIQGLRPAATPARIPEAGRYRDIVAGPAAKSCAWTSRTDSKAAAGLRSGHDRDQGHLVRRLHGHADGSHLGAPRQLQGGRLCSPPLFGKDTEPPAAKIVKSTDDEIVLEIRAKDKRHTVTVKPKAKKVAVEVK